MGSTSYLYGALFQPHLKIPFSSLVVPVKDSLPQIQEIADRIASRRAFASGWGGLKGRC